MTPEAQAGLVMTGAIVVACGAVILLTEPLRRRQRALAELYEERKR